MPSSPAASASARAPKREAPPMPLNSASSKPADVAVSTPGPTSPTRSLAPATASPISPFLPPPDSEGVNAGQSGEARIFLIQDDNLTAEVPLRRSILQSTLRQKYRSTGRHNPQRDGGPEKGLYRLHPIALGVNGYPGTRFSRTGRYQTC